MKAAKDPNLLAEAKKVKRPIAPVDAKVIEALYKEMFSMSAEDRRAIAKVYGAKGVLSQ